MTGPAPQKALRNGPAKLEALARVRPLDCAFELDAPQRNSSWYTERGYELMSTALFRTACTEAAAVLDIGAHVGYYTLVGALAAPAAQTIAIEASPENAATVRRNLELNGITGVDVRTAAFSDTTGKVAFQLTEASDNNGLSGHPNSPTIETIEVDCVTGSTLDLPGGDRIVIKVDVEGHEPQALDGLREVFDAYADVRLLIEFNPKTHRQTGSDPDALVEQILDLGFRVFLIDEEQFSWHELTEPNQWQPLMEPQAYANLYCVRNQHCHSLAVLLHTNGLGGSERSQVEMVESLIRQGCLVHTVLPGVPSELSGQLHQLGGSVAFVESLPWWYGDPGARAVAASSWNRTDVVAEVVDALAAVDPDVVLTQTGTVLAGALAAAGLGKPHIWYLREFGDLDHELALPAEPAQVGELVAALSAQVITNSAAVRDHFFGGPNPKVQVIHPAPRLATRDEAPRAERPWTIGVVGTLCEGKGQLDVVQAVGLLRQEGLDVPLVLAGGERPAYAAALRQAVETAGVPDLVAFVGTISDRNQLYALFDAVVVSSRAEAFGRVPFEATAAGLPVVFAEVAGPTEYLGDGVTGVAYSPGDPVALAAALRALRDQRDRGAGLVAAAVADLLGDDRRDRFDAAIIDAVGQAAASQPAQALLPELVGAIERAALADHLEATDLAAELAAVSRVAAEQSEQRAQLAVQAQQLSSEVAELNAQGRAQEDALKKLRSERNHARKQLKRIHRSRLWRLRNRLVKILRLKRSS